VRLQTVTTISDVEVLDSERVRVMIYDHGQQRCSSHAARFAAAVYERRPDALVPAGYREAESRDALVAWAEQSF
jgi:hypothetical protein